MACTETLTVVTPILSPSPRSARLLTFGSRVRNHSGRAESEPADFTARLPLALDQSVTNTVVPAEAMSRLPEIRPSLIGLPPENWNHFTLVLDRPAALSCCSSR